ncbi:NnrU family protein [Paraburkholderia phymatum]|uniref:NnrU family protein n=1 Tax=Paraburkholderia phymatum (strain DSM 17167 / CIP 108236 / LMG 21445 / STM815) TaxID=391038 RepID=B2JUD7_PARP8|nr:NnrU family protein [Paraburkholderia phymatum]ACC74659.1 NnrU family protein [Paraburkholderia phymatum STM815]
MSILILGLLIFLGGHSVRIFAEGWRKATIERMGAKNWKAAYSVVSLVGLVLIIWGYGIARREPVVLWTSPAWSPHLTGVLTLIAFILFPAAHAPGNHFKSIVKHPMTAGVGLWALAHLFVSATLHAVVLFGAFLVWAVFDYAAARRRDRAEGVVYPGGTLSRDVMPVVAGVVLWVAFVFFLHGWLIGVKPFV